MSFPDGIHPQYRTRHVCFCNEITGSGKLPCMIQMVFHPVKGFGPDDGGETHERVLAGIASILLTTMIGAAFLRPLDFQEAPPPAHEQDAFRVVFVDRSPAPRITQQPQATKHTQPAASAHPEHAKVISTVDAAPVEPALPATTNLGAPDDAWSIPEANYAFQSSTDRLIGKTAPPLETHVDRLHVRMKEPITVEVVLKEVGKSLGFWPPGYTDDPVQASTVWPTITGRTRRSQGVT